MKKLFTILILGAGLMLITACEKEEITRIENTPEVAAEFTVPELPPEIEAMMPADELEKFKAGPGEKYLNQIRSRSWNGGRWHPVIMQLDYFLQFAPIGYSCAPGEFVFCVGPMAPPDINTPDCIANQVGMSGQTIADGYWFWKAVHAEYYPVFCGANGLAGYGNGFYALNNGSLALTAESTPFQYNDNGDIIFYRYGQYIGDQSTGVYEGAFGWEVSVMYTPAETYPDPVTGQGASEVITLGWVHY